jgi:hypothetical protein
VTLTARIGWLTVFAAAFGFVETAVVVYLRALFYPDGFDFPIEILALGDTVTMTELAREVATLLMLLGTAGLAARRFWGRFGAFAYAFGIWDIVFYIGLKVVLDWPESLGTWDVLFLIPGVWTGPVWSPLVIAVLLAVCGARMMQDEARGRVPALRWTHWVAGAVSLLLLLTAFLWNHEPVYRGEMHGAFPWPVWLAGIVVGLATFLHLERGSSSERPTHGGRHGSA